MQKELLTTHLFSFGRRILGVRERLTVHTVSELIVDENGEVIKKTQSFKTCEALITYAESKIRQYVSANILAILQGLSYLFLPKFGVPMFVFSLALAQEDYQNDFQVSPTTVDSFTLTPAGTNRGMYVMSDDGTGSTYAPTTFNTTETMTQVETATQGQTGISWKLIAPSSGAHTLTITRVGTSNRIHCWAVAVSGADQTTLVGAHNSGTHAASDPSHTITTTRANSFIFGHVFLSSETGSSLDENGTPTAAQQTSFGTIRDNFCYKSVTTVTTYTFDYTGSTGTSWGYTNGEVMEFATSGPTNVKTWDGVTQSTGIKTYMGNTLANTKSVNGVT